MSALIESNPTGARYYYDKSRCLLALQKSRDALSFVGTAIALKPNDPKFHLMNISLLLRFDDFTAAKKSLALAKKHCRNENILDDVSEILRSTDRNTARRSCCPGSISRFSAIERLRQRTEERNRVRIAQSQNARIMREIQVKEKLRKEIYCFEIFEFKELPKSTDGKPINYAIKAIMGNGEEKLLRKPSSTNPSVLILKPWMIDDANGIIIQITASENRGKTLIASYRIYRYSCSRKARRNEFVQEHLVNEYKLPTKLEIIARFKLINTGEATVFQIRNRLLRTQLNVFSAWSQVKVSKRRRFRKVLESTFCFYADLDSKKNNNNNNLSQSLSKSVIPKPDKIQEVREKLIEIKAKRKYWFDRIMRFYKSHNAEKANEAHIVKLMRINTGIEAKLYERLHKKYNVFYSATDFLQNELRKSNEGVISQEKTRELLGIPNAKKHAMEVSQLDTIDTIDMKERVFGTAKTSIYFHSLTMSAFLSCLEDIKLDTVAASSIFIKKSKEMWLEEVEIERSRAWHSRSPAKEVKRIPGLNFRYFCRALLQVYITLNRYPKKRLAFLYSNIVNKHIYKYSPIFESRRKSLNTSIYEDVWKFSQDKNLKNHARKQYLVSRAAHILTQNWRKIRARRKARDILRRFMVRALQHSREAQNRALSLDNMDNDSFNDDDSDETITGSPESNDGCTKLYKRVFQMSNEEESEDSDSDDANGIDEENNKKMANNIADLQCSVDYVDIKETHGIVFLDDTPPSELIIGQIFVIIGITKGPCDRSVNFLSSTSGKFVGKCCFRIHKIDAVLSSISFELLGRKVRMGTYGKSVGQSCYINARESRESKFYRDAIRRRHQRVARPIVATNVFNAFKIYRQKWREKKLNEELLVDWKKTENRNAFLNLFVLRWWQFMALALRFGPLHVKEESEQAGLNTIASFNSTVNTTSSIEKTEEVGYVTWRIGFASHPILRILLVAIDLITHLPQFQLPPEYGNTYPFFFALAAFISLLFPFYVKHAIIRVRKGKLGVDDHGRALRKFSKADIYMRVLNYVNNNCYFGIMATLFSAFSCFYDDGGEKFYLKIDSSTVCFNRTSIHSIYMSFASLGLISFYPVATALIPSFQFSSKALDLKFDKVFVLIENQADVIVIISFVFFGDEPVIVLCVQLFVCCALAWICHHMHPCLVESMNKWKTVVYLSAAYITADALLFLHFANVTVYVCLLVSLPIIVAMYKSNKVRGYKRKTTSKVLPAKCAENKDVQPGENTNENKEKDVEKEQLRPAHNATAVLVDEPSRNSNVIKEAEYKCPECRSIGSKSQWVKTYLECKCCVCFEYNQMFVSTVCGHGVCISCIKNLKNTPALTQHV